ncbi:MAG: SMI1/KNR4 family protein [Actinobacteria bacterium]|nr:SMI1/KNR4 family protein [Actinomycetota bacterium]
MLVARALGKDRVQGVDDEDHRGEYENPDLNPENLLDFSLVALVAACHGLPPLLHRTFVLRFGAGSMGAHEFYGVINTPFSGGVPDGVWSTLSDRAGPSQLPRTMIAIGDDGMGGTYVLDTAKALEPPVEVWNGGASRPGEPLEQLAPDFATFLLDAVQREVATGH